MTILLLVPSSAGIDVISADINGLTLTDFLGQEWS